MHTAMREALNTYRKYGTDMEAAAIDALTSPIGFRRTRLQRAVA
jgi:hypothetical protein